MKILSACLAAVVIAPLSVYSSPMIVDLGASGSFAVLAGSTVTNTGATAVFGDLGVSPGTAITGFPPGVVTGGTIHSNDAAAVQAQADLGVAYAFAAGQACDTDLTGQNLGGLTLTAGVYCFDSSSDLTGILTLDAQGDPDAVFLFQIGSTLITASDASVLFVNGGEGDTVFWQVGSSATLGTGTAFAGNILALTSITLNTGATIECGRALARNGAVTMDTNTVSTDTAGCEAGSASVPEPGTAMLLATGVFLVWIARGIAAKQAA